MKLNPDLNEIEPLRLKLKDFHEIKARDFGRYPHFKSNTDFYKFMQKEPWINGILHTPFNKLPLIIHQCPKEISTEWYLAIIAWRLQIGE